jgi:hypothetical protein
MRPATLTGQRGAAPARHPLSRRSRSGLPSARSGSASCRPELGRHPPAGFNPARCLHARARHPADPSLAGIRRLDSTRPSGPGAPSDAASRRKPQAQARGMRPATPTGQRGAAPARLPLSRRSRSGLPSARSGSASCRPELGRHPPAGCNPARCLHARARHPADTSLAGIRRLGSTRPSGPGAPSDAASRRKPQAQARGMRPATPTGPRGAAPARLPLSRSSRSGLPRGMRCCHGEEPPSFFAYPSHVRRARPSSSPMLRRASAKSALLAPRSRSVNVIGTSTIRPPARCARQRKSSWNA